MLRPASGKGGMDEMEGKIGIDAGSDFLEQVQLQLAKPR